MKLGILFLLVVQFAAAQAPEPKPCVKDPQCVASIGTSAAEYFWTARVATDNENGRYTRDTRGLPYGAGWNYGLAAGGTLANAGLTLLGRHLTNSDTPFWKFLGTWLPPISSSVILIPGNIHRMHAHRNNVPIW